MVKYRFSCGMTPEKVIEKMLPESYSMRLNSSDYTLFAKIVNLGIDSRLQAISADSAANQNLDKQSMICLINRLLDYSDFGENCDSDLLDSDEKFNAFDLRSCILETIGIEEI